MVDHLSISDLSKRSFFKRVLMGLLVSVAAPFEPCKATEWSWLRTPFDRYLGKSMGVPEYPLAMFGPKARYLWQEVVYEVEDPQEPGKLVKLHFRDRTREPAQPAVPCRLDLKYFTILHDKVSGKPIYRYQFEPQLVAAVKEGHRETVDQMSSSMLKAISLDQDFQFLPAFIVRS